MSKANKAAGWVLIIIFVIIPLMELYEAWLDFKEEVGL